MTLGIAPMGWLVLGLIFVPPPAFVVAAFMATRPGSLERRASWRRFAWAFGVLSLVSVVLLVWIINGLDHTFDGH